MVELDPKYMRGNDKERVTYDPTPPVCRKLMEDLGRIYLSEEDIDGDDPDETDTKWYETLEELEKLADEHAELTQYFKDVR
jgi:hypothetical protein